MSLSLKKEQRSSLSCGLFPKGELNQPALSCGLFPKGKLNQPALGQKFQLGLGSRPTTLVTS